jgi:hypothetical protein
MPIVFATDTLRGMPLTLILFNLVRRHQNLRHHK